jgi:hypothetical protein
MKNAIWHIHVHMPISIHGESDTLVTLDPGEYAMREADLISYAIGPRDHPKGRLRLAELLKLRGSGAITIDGAFP